MSSNVTDRAPRVAITDVPPELIAAILEYLDLGSTRSYYSDLIRVTHSTSYLRQAAINAPNLWTSIEITDNPSSFELAKACLERSRAQAIDISIRMNRRLKSRLNGLLAMVNYTATRLRSLDMRVCLSDFHLEWLQINTCFQKLVAPHLQHLCVEIAIFHEFATSPHHTLPMPQVAGHLTTLSLNNLTPDLSHPHTVSSIKALTLSSKWFWDWPYLTLIRALNASHSLEELTLMRTAAVPYGRRRSARSLPTIPPILLPKLRQFTIKNVENDFVALLLTNMVTPELEGVVIEQTEGLNAADHTLRFDWNQIPSFPGFHSVVSLHVDIRAAVVFHKDQFAVFLVNVFPNLETLYMPWRTGRELVQAWTSHWNLVETPDAAGSVAAWRGLRQLVLTGQDCVTCSWNCPHLLEDIFQLLQTRKKHNVPPLDLLRFDVCESVKKWEGYRVARNRLRQLLSSPDAMDMVLLGGSEWCSQYRH